MGYSAGSGSSDLIGRQTTIIGANGVNIYTGDNTHIKGAVIAALNDNLTLNTGTLSYENMKGSMKSASLGLGLTASWSPRKDASDKDNQPKTDTSWLGTLAKKRDELNKQWNTFKKDMIVAPGAFSYSDAETEQTARATVGRGVIIVRDNPNADLSGLNRDTSQALTEEVIRNTSIALDPLFSYVDTAFSYTGTGLNLINAPKKADGGGEDEGNKPTNEPEKRFIQDTLEKWYRSIKAAWGVKDQAQKP
jgi:filamentous hemagglutinin